MFAVQRHKAGGSTWTGILTPTRVDARHPPFMLWQNRSGGIRSMEHPHAALVRTGYEAFAKGDMDTVNEFFADDVVWHEGGRNLFTGDHAGKDQVFALFGKMMELSDGTFTVALHDVVANDDHTVALVNTSMTRKGRSISDTEVHVIHVRDGKVAEVWPTPSNQSAWDELLGN